MTMELVKVEPGGPMPLRGWRAREEKLRREISQKLEEIRGWDWWDDPTYEVMSWLEDQWSPETGLDHWSDAQDVVEGIRDDIREHDGMGSQTPEWEEIAELFRRYGAALACLGNAEKEEISRRKTSS